MHKIYSINKAVKTFSDILKKEHPELFGASCCRPWKIGIHKDIIEAYRLLLEEMAQRCMDDGHDIEDMDKVIQKIVSRALANKARTPSYAWALISNKKRYGLDGQEAGEVSQSDKREAEKRLEMFEQIRKKKKSACASDVVIRNFRDSEYLEYGANAGVLRSKAYYVKPNKEKQHSRLPL